jgi:CubicO group peptidase (beta-lactamase class C family)
MNILAIVFLLAVTTPPEGGGMAAALQGVVDKAVADDKFSGVVMLAKDGKPLHAQAWGMADPATKTPNRTDTKFNIGSINKIFTKVAIGQLAADGKLALTDTIRKHLPDFPAAGADKITIQQLLDNRSGLGDTFGPKYMATNKSLRKLSDYVPLFADKPLEFEPGTSQRYSNAGYVTLGLIIEKLSGQSYYDYVRDHIFKPAGMTDTASYFVDEKVPNRAIGQTKRGPTGPLPQRKDNYETLPGRGSSAGGGYSTANDLLRFSNALLGEKLLSKEWTDWVFGTKGDATAAALQVRNMGVAGGAPGLNALLEIEPPYTLIVLSNYDPPSAEEVGSALRPLLGGPKRVMRRGPQAPGGVLIAGPVELPMSIENHLPTIEAKINGKGPFRFGIDTGFGHTMQVTSALAEKLGLAIAGEVLGGDPSGKNQESMKLRHIDSVEIGDARFASFDAVERTAPQDVDGIIGLPLFNSLVATFDYPGGRFKLDGGSLPTGANVLSYTTEGGGVPTIEIDVAGQKVTAHIDSGSPSEVSVPLSIAKSLPLGEEPRVVGRGRTLGNSFDVYAAPLEGDVRVGDVVLARPRLDFVDLFPVGNVGFRFLSPLVVTFDPANRRVRFVKP